MMTDNKPRDLLTDALVLAVVPALGYTLTVFHELGYMTYFNLPVSLIRIDTPMALIKSTYVLVPFLVILFFLNCFTEQIESLINNAKSNWFFPGSLVFIVALVPYITGAKYIKDGENVVLITALFIFLSQFIPLLFYPSKIPFATRIEKATAEDDKIKYWSRTLLQRLARPVLTLISLILFAVYFSFNLGVREARHEKWFLVPESASDTVVLRIYGDNCITSKFDRANQEMIPHFTIQPLGDAVPKEAAVLRYEPIGPLKPWDKN
jgi:hypothetical protein